MYYLLLCNKIALNCGLKPQHFIIFHDSVAWDLLDGSSHARDTDRSLLWMHSTGGLARALHPRWLHSHIWSLTGMAGTFGASLPLSP